MDKLETIVRGLKFCPHLAISNRRFVYTVVMDSRYEVRLHGVAGLRSVFVLYPATSRRLSTVLRFVLGITFN